ncbi:MAG: DNA-directed RNA polymerase subunit D [archaeon ADurb.Bin336]|nr:MAG: DNA-directed RNA polymerase subunit D [archaeon ADurb.Bin336]
MDIKKVYDEKDVVKYLVKGTNYTFLNTLRRTIMTDVPCLAISEVQIYNNDSVTFDELLANRLGLLPIKTDVSSYKKGDKVKLVLEKIGPCVVTSKDIKCTDPKIDILDKKILITKLGKEESLKLEMTAVMETGSKNVRYQPAIVSYNQISEINNDTVKDAKKIIEEMPKGSVELKAGKLFFTDPYNVVNQNQHLDILRKYRVSVNYSETDFILTIELTGQLTAKEVLDSALDSLNAKLGELEEAIKKL